MADLVIYPYEFVVKISMLKMPSVVSPIGLPREMREKRTSVMTISKGKNRVNNAAFTDGL
jgi:hypothetical protein